MPYDIRIVEEVESAMNDSEPRQDVFDELGRHHRALREMIPDVYWGLAEMRTGAMASDVLDEKIKELMAMAIGVATGCDDCAAKHAKRAAREGASNEEAAAAIGVGIAVHGELAAVRGAHAYAAFRELADSPKGEAPE
jgi:AhpD family alkylhydroperoxidase